MPAALRQLALALLLAAPLTGAADAAPAVLRLATHDQAPYGTYVGTGAAQVFDGIAVRVVECTLKRMKQPYSIEVFPWTRAQRMAEVGEVDGFFPATLKPERLVWAASSDVIAGQKWVWYLRAAEPWDPNAADFKANAKVGAHLGSNRLKMLEDQGYHIVLRPPSDFGLLRAFMAGRADAILGGDLAIAEAMKRLEVDPKSLRAVVAQDSPLHAYFTRKFLQTDATFVKRFNAQMPACR